MSLNPDGRENKIKLISDTMTGFYSVMRNLQEDYATYHQNYSEEALALLSRSDDFIESVEAVRSLDSLSRIDDEGINELFLLSQQIAELYHLKVQTKIEDEKPKTLPKKIKSEKSFWNTLWGALQGEYNENPTGMEILIDMGINFIPGVGQVCDARDITACLKKLVIDRRVNEVMIWVTLLLTAIGCVPYAGDVIKAGCKAIIKGADDAVLKVLRKLDADDVQKAFKMLRSKFTSSIDDAIAMVNKWIKEAGNSKYGSKINEVLTGANENLRKAADFITGKIDEFGEKVFGNGKKLSYNSVQKNIVEEVKKDPKTLENLEHPHNFTRHGNFGEMVVDVDLEGTGHIKRISMQRVTSLDAPMHHGIDGIYENLTPPPDFFVVDSKYLSSEVSKADTFAPTMTYYKNSDITQLDNNWIIKNIEDEFMDAEGFISPENNEKMQKIITAIQSNDESKCLRIAGKVDNTGKVTYYKYGSDGKVLTETKIINGKEKNVPVIWDKGE